MQGLEVATQVLEQRSDGVHLAFICVVGLVQLDVLLKYYVGGCSAARLSCEVGVMAHLVKVVFYCAIKETE